MHEIEIPFGKHTIRLELDDRVQILKPGIVEGLIDPERNIRNSLRTPIGSKPLAELVNKNSNVAIILSDKKRAFPQKEILSTILEELNQKEVNKISIVIANGRHEIVRLSEYDFLRELSGKIQIYNHDCNDAGNLLTIGYIDSKFKKYLSFEWKRFQEIARKLKNSFSLTKLLEYTISFPVLFVWAILNLRKKEVRVNSLVQKSDVRILIGMVKPHFYAGYGGGAKAIIPGVCGGDFIAKNHSLIFHPSVAQGIVDGNILREELEEAAQLCGLSFLINVITNSNGAITHIVSGDIIKAHREGVSLCKKMTEVKSKTTDIVIATDSLPVTSDIYQIRKLLGSASKLVNQDGVIIIVGGCEETSVKKVSYTRKIAHHLRIRRAFPKFIINNIYLKRLLPENVSLLLVSKLPKDFVKYYSHFEPVESIQEALEYSYKKLGRDATISVVLNSTLVDPIL